MRRFLILGTLLFVVMGCVQKKDFVLFQDEPQGQETASVKAEPGKKAKKRESSENFKHFMFDKESVKAEPAEEPEAEATPPVVEQTITKPFIIEYKIAPKDRLGIQVYNQTIPVFPPMGALVNTTSAVQPNEVIVGLDGTLVLPMIGKTALAGLTEDEAASVLTDRFAKYYRHPFVRLEVLNKRVYVIGEVRKPGPIAMDHDRITVIEAIAQAGDLNEYADRTGIVVINGSNSLTPKMSKLDLTRIASLSSTSLMLYPGDIIYVQPNKMRAVNVNVHEYLPTLQLISATLNPFVSIKYLED